MAKRNGAAKWITIVIAGAGLVVGATAAHTRALAQIRSNTENIERFAEMSDSIRAIELAIVKIAERAGVEVNLRND